MTFKVNKKWTFGQIGGMYSMSPQYIHKYQLSSSKMSHVLIFISAASCSSERRFWFCVGRPDKSSEVNEHHSVVLNGKTLRVYVELMDDRKQQMLFCFPIIVNLKALLLTAFQPEALRRRAPACGRSLCRWGHNSNSAVQQSTVGRGAWSTENRTADRRCWSEAEWPGPSPEPLENRRTGEPAFNAKHYNHQPERPWWTAAGPTFSPTN